MKSAKMFLTRIARLSMTDNVTKFQRSNAGQSTDVNATLLTSKSVTPPMDKNVPPSTRRSVRRLGMKSSAMTFQNKTVVKFPRLNARHQLSALSAGSCQRLQREAKKTLCLSSKHQNQGGVHAGVFHHKPASV